MKKSVYKAAMSRVKTSENFKEDTYQKLMAEMEKTTQPTNHIHSKERLTMEKAKKRTVTGWTVGIAACAVLSFSIYTATQQSPSTTNTVNPPITESKPPMSGKAQVNIDGVISEVSADGKSFKVGDLWVTVTQKTEMGIPGPNAAEPSDELLQKEFKVGNIVSGYTTGDVSTGNVNATRIYNNMAPAKEEATKPISGKVQVNIDGVISEVSADGKSFKVGDLWVTVTQKTEMGIHDPNAGEPSDELLQKEFKVGNIVSGYTTGDVSTGKVNATRIYNNMAPAK